MNDLISRKALCDYALNQKDKSVTPNDIMRLPSAQPQDVVDKNKLVETIKHYMQYPDGLNRLLAIYGGN